MHETLTIGQAAKLTGIPPRTIRFYEDEGLLPAPERSRTGYRVFGPDDIRRLRLIRRAKSLGIPLAEVRALVARAFDDSCGSFEGRLAELVADRLSQVERSIHELEVLRAELVDMGTTLGEPGASGHVCRAGDCEQCRFIDD